ncbi:ganglioside GM2 activator-like isoform X2 [Littorina saxatilis]|uniref:MD-2-related lipid-recognition domain-containing protein n=1 Tax=Littorina saxatilis TaxID=31220 RepID=A0AAN9G706_9CAEN
MREFFLVVFAALAACTIGVPSVVRFAVNNEYRQNVRLQTYSFKNCLPADQEMGVVSRLVFSPDPLSFPGPLNVSFAIDVKSTVSAPLKGSLYLGKKIDNTWIKVPCIGQIGSCSYDDVCALLSGIPGCPQPFVDAGIPCQCPFQKGSYNLPVASFDVNTAVFPPGDYHLQANLTYNNQPVGCYDIMVTFG